MIPEIEHLKSVIDGKADLPRWLDWIEEHKLALERAFTRGRFLRLKYHPLSEIPRVLEEHGIFFVPSNVNEWSDLDSKKGLCRHCSAQIQTARYGDVWWWCPNGCFEMEAHFGPPGER